MADLTDRQQRFTDEYLVDLNATQAAIRAGYSERTARKIASHLLTKPAVAAAIAKAIASRSERTVITQDWVLNGFRDIAERCQQNRPVLDRKGDPVMVETPGGKMAPAYTFDSAGAIRSLELIGRHLGMFIDRAEFAGRRGGPIVTETRVVAGNAAAALDEIVSRFATARRHSAS